MLIQLLFFLILSTAQVHSTRYSCDFESFCSLLNFDSFWGKTDGATRPKPQYPDHDHTFQNSSGHYMFFYFNGESKFKDSKVQFRPFFNTSNSNVSLKLTFSYIISSNREKQNFTIQLILGDSNDLTPKWLTLNTFKDKTFNWTTTSLILPNDAYYINFVVSSSSMNSDSVILGIDDVFIDEIPSTEPDVPKVVYYCDFELNNCSFENKMRLEWSRVLASNNSNLGPSIDHTTNSSKGFYLTTAPMGYSTTGLLQRSISPIFEVPNTNTTYCLSFYYFLKSYSSFIYVYAVPLTSINDTDTTYKLANMIWPSIFNVQFLYGNWIWAITDLDPGFYRIVFLFSSTELNSQSVSIDDVKVHACPAVNQRKDSYQRSAYFEYECDFESNNCGFENVTSDGYPSNWTRISGEEAQEYDSPVDHTSLSAFGHYYKVDIKNPIFSAFSSSAKSVPLFAHVEMCVEFYLYANAEVFDPNLKAQFSITAGGCYGAYIYFLSPFNNQSYTPQWNRYLVQLKNYACNENIYFNFYCPDFIKLGLAIDDIKINRCDILNKTEITTTTVITTTEKITTTSETTQKTTEETTSYNGNHNHFRNYIS